MLGSLVTGFTANYFSVTTDSETAMHRGKSKMPKSVVCYVKPGGPK